MYKGCRKMQDSFFYGELRYVIKIFLQCTVGPNGLSSVCHFVPLKSSSMKPSFVQNKYDMFKSFSASTFRNHWNATKKMFEDRMFYHYPLFCVIFLSIVFQLALSLVMNDILNDSSITGINEIDACSSGSSSRGEKRKFEEDENEPSTSRYVKINEK